MAKTRGEYVLEPGPNSWLNLSENLLSKKGKKIVSDDPDLGPDTIQELKSIEKTDLSDYSFFFYDTGDKRSSDIGLAVLSMCIRENPYATMAEIVARYSDTRGIPFVHVATVLDVFRKKERFVMYVRDHDGLTYKAVKWHPAAMSENESILPPPKRKKAGEGVGRPCGSNCSKGA